MTLLTIALAAIFLVFGIAKFARYEQDAVEKLVARHPLLRFGPKLLSSAGFSILLGGVELLTAFLLMSGILAPSLGLAGALLGVLTFVVTLSLFPFVQYFEASAGRMFLSSRGQFLMKDLGLLAGCVTLAHHFALNTI
jgi:uncharacterized membrane protein YkgB